MDLSRPITYRAYELNTIETLVGDGKRRGCMVEEADYGDVAGIGYTEKRSQGDGLDATDITLGARMIRLRGFIYGETEADGFDRLQDLRSIFTPTSAYADSTYDRGYLPLEFEVETQKFVDFPNGVKQLEMRARPRAQPRFSIRRDGGSQTGQRPYKGNAIEWTVFLECRDPRIYIRPTHFIYLNLASPMSIPLANRGDYPAPLDILLDVPAASAAGTVLIEVAGCRMEITVPNSSFDQVIRYSGDLKVMTVTENSVESLRMDLFEFLTVVDNPAVAPGGSTATVTVTGATLNPATSRFMYNESLS
jgi:hypothetical protein